MKSRLVCIAMILAGSSCRLSQVPRQEPQPRASPDNPGRDSAPPAARDSFIIVIPFRETCRMPVARGDESRDSFTVVRIPAQRRSAAAGLCHNPLFR